MYSFSLLIKPAGPDCNLVCEYCFYRGKTDMFGGGKHRMSEQVLESLISDYMKLKFPVSHFAWQGGEPTLMGLDFFKKVIQLQRQYGKAGQAVSNSLQTNGILLDGKWCEFLRQNKFLVGISLDGPKKYHDHYRVDQAGNGTFDKVMAAIELCRKHKVEFNVLVLLNNRNVAYPEELFDFFIEQKIGFLQFIPCLEKVSESGGITEFSVTAKQYGDFMCKTFDFWYDHGPEKLSIRMFDSLMNYLLHGQHTVCTLSDKCDDYIVVEHNGDVFCCDFFVNNQCRSGNILSTPIDKLARSDIKDRFSSQKNKVHNKCFVCRYKQMCCGGCLKDRIMENNDFACPSYFCEAYKQFFEHVIPRLRMLAADSINITR